MRKVVLCILFSVLFFTGSQGRVKAGIFPMYSDEKYISMAWTKSELIAYLASDPILSDSRKATVVKGLELLGYTKYQLGAKAGNFSEVIPKYLDCSGFVQWVLIRAAGYNIGHGTALQYAVCTPIEEWQLTLGDLGFIKPGGVENLGGNNHVGFFLGYNADGQKLWLHCASGSQNGVGISTCDSFVYYARPSCY